MVSKSFTLAIDGRTYQVQVVRSGVISIDGEIYNVEGDEKGVRINGELLTASLSGDFAVVGGKLYETEWRIG